MSTAAELRAAGQGRFADDPANRAAAIDVIRDLASLAEGHLAAARDLCAGRAPEGDEEAQAVLAEEGVVPSAARVAFLPAVRARLYLDELRKCDYDIHDDRLWPLPKMEQQRLGFQMRLLGVQMGLAQGF